MKPIPAWSATGLLLCLAAGASDLPRITEQIESNRKSSLGESGKTAGSPSTGRHALNVRVVFLNKREELPQVQVNAAPGGASFTHLDLTPSAREVEQGSDEKPHPVTYYGFRFKTPSEKGMFCWAAPFPGGWHSTDSSSWYVIESGGQTHFSAWLPRYELPETISGIGRKDERFLLHQYPPGFLQADTEYIFAFKMTDSMARNFRVSLNLFPEGYTFTSYMEVFPMLFPNYIQNMPADKVPLRHTPDVGRSESSTE